MPEAPKQYEEDVFIQPALGPRSGSKEFERLHNPTPAELPTRPSTAHAAGDRPSRMMGLNDNVSASAAVGSYSGRRAGPSSGPGYDQADKHSDVPDNSSMMTPLPDGRLHHPGPMHTPMDDSIVITDEPTMDYSPECTLS